MWHVEAPGLTRTQLQDIGAKMTELRASAPPKPSPAQCAEEGPGRRHLLDRCCPGRALSGGGLPSIASHFDATQQAVNHHLQVLAKAGLLSERRDGARRLYALDPGGLSPVREVLTELWPSALARLKHVVERDQKGKR